MMFRRGRWKQNVARVNYNNILLLSLSSHIVSNRCVVVSCTTCVRRVYNIIIIAITTVEVIGTEHEKSLLEGTPLRPCAQLVHSAACARCV